MATSKSTTEAPALEVAAQSAPDEQTETVLRGRLTADPIKRVTGKGRSVANLRIAVNPADGGEASFHSIVVWGKQADAVARCKKRGHPVEVTGVERTRSYQDKDGNERQITEIVARRVQFLDRQDLPRSAEKQVA